VPDLLVDPPSVLGDRAALVAWLERMRALGPEIGNRDQLIAFAEQRLALHDEIVSPGIQPTAE
jgi:hypothetical protein